MSNWFEKNQTKSVISYTILVSVATWGALYFILDENKTNLYKAQVSNQLVMNRQLEQKISVLEQKILELSNDNKQLQKWVSETPGTYPVLKNRIEELERALKEETAKAKNSTDNSNVFSSIQSKEIEEKYKYSEVLVEGQSFTDPLTNATIGVADIGIDGTADVYLSLPGFKGEDISRVKPGTTWSFKYEAKEYVLTINTVDWIRSKWKATVTEM